MFRGKKWLRYLKKQHETAEEIHARRRAAAIKGHKSRRKMRLLRAHKAAEDSGEAISIEVHNMFPVVHSSDPSEK
jgi:hypothetical protein